MISPKKLNGNIDDRTSNCKYSDNARNAIGFEKYFKSTYDGM